MDRAELLDKVLAYYAGSYDIVRTGSDNGLAATAVFHEHGVGFMLIRKAEMWSADRHEYAWFYTAPHLTLADCEKWSKEALDAGLQLVDPKEGHMSTAISAIFICDSADAEAVEKLKKTKFRKDFQFGLKGWTALHTAVVELGADRVTSNGEGRNERIFLSSVLHPKKKRHILRDVFKWMRELI